MLYNNCLLGILAMRVLIKTIIHFDVIATPLKTKIIKYIAVTSSQYYSVYD